MDTNPYEAPSSRIADSELGENKQRFYVVSLPKFLVLFFITAGMYQVYWTYKHWAQFKRATKGDEWPVMRAIFSVFFTHSLFNEIGLSLERSPFKYPWAAGLFGGLATLFLLTGNVLDRMAAKDVGSPYTDLMSLAVIPLLGFFLYQGQRAANHACGDPQGETNQQFTAANIVWIILGVLFWGLIALGIVAIMFPEQFSE
jgi:hypothetical protein